MGDRNVLYKAAKLKQAATYEFESKIFNSNNIKISTWEVYSNCYKLSVR